MPPAHVSSTGRSTRRHTRAFQSRSQRFRRIAVRFTIIRNRLGRQTMSGVKIIGVVLLVLGILGLAIGHFEYTKETHEGQFGPFRFSVTEKDTAVIPGWASIAAI